ncbi:GNAT family N-acetyltransferase [Nocardioides sp. Root140]|uniref:GNAT family N-acetyltransferase n=1 Tax=Nocardioides sp. Root140 TaxID=1736460 RepID=UPI000AAA062A|nr:GNAT family N-acetyltransferase [Nocardioides sp. Root140]
MTEGKGMSCEIVRVDPFDDEAFEAWYATYAAADAHGREELAATWTLAELRAQGQAVQEHQESAWWSGLLEGRTVVAGKLRLTHHDNRDLAMVEVFTEPAHRTHGHGSAMLAVLEEQARAAGRTRLLAECSYPIDAPQDGSGHPYADFLRHRGFTFGIGDVQRILDLPVPEDDLHALVDSAASSHASYTFRSFAGQIPEELLAEYAALCGALMTEAPTGDLVLESSHVDVDAFRAEQEVLERQGRTRYGTVAIADDGTLAGYTDIVASAHDRGRGYQWGTLVWSAHRGHRLGLALKARNLVSLQRERPDLGVVRTWNAEVNDHMVAVNDLLGFRPVERLGEFQKNPGAS